VRWLARFDNVDRLLLATLLGAAAIHATVVHGLLAQWPAAGIAVLLLMIAEVDTALLFQLRLRSAPYVAAAVVSAGPLLVWVYALTAGLPFGPHAGAAQRLSLTGTTAALLEVATLAIAVAALRHRRRPRRAATKHSVRLAVTGVVAVSVIGAAVGIGAMGSATPLPRQHHHHHATA
jgi:nitrate reductase NapE component